MNLMCKVFHNCSLSTQLLQNFSNLIQHIISEIKMSNHADGIIPDGETVNVILLQLGNKTFGGKTFF